jgi:hypothetical protein
VTDRLRYGLFATILGVTGIALSVLGFLAARSPAAAKLVATSEGIASLVTGLSFTAITCAVVLYYGRRSRQLSTAYQDLHRATLQRERSEAALRESERFTRATLDAMDAQIAALDADGGRHGCELRLARAAASALRRRSATSAQLPDPLRRRHRRRAAEAARVAAAIRRDHNRRARRPPVESHSHVDGLVVTRVTRCWQRSRWSWRTGRPALARAPQAARPGIGD